MKRWILLGVVAISFIIMVGLRINTGQIDNLNIHLDKVIHHAKELSSPKLEGRLTGSEGNNKAISYIENEIKDLQNSSEAKRRFEVSKMPFTFPQLQMKETPVFEIFSEGNNVVTSGEVITRFTYGEDFKTQNIDRGGNIDFEGEIIVVTDSIYGLEPELIEGRVVVTQMNRVTDAFIDDLIDRGAVGLLNNYTRVFSFNSITTKKDTSKSVRVDWKRGNQLYVASISLDTFEFLKESAKENLYEEHSILGSDSSVGHMEEQVTGLIPSVRLKSKASYPISKSENIIVKFPGKSSESGAVIFSSDIDGYGLEPNGNVINSNAQALSSGVVLEAMGMMSRSESQAQKEIYFVFLNGSKQGDYGMKTFFDSLPKSGQVEWIHIQNTGGVAKLPIRIGESATTSSDRQWALDLKLQLHADNKGIQVERGLPEEELPGFSKLIEADIPHIIISSGTDRYSAKDEFEDLDLGHTNAIARVIESFIYRDLLAFTSPDYLSTVQVGLGLTLISLAIIFMVINKISKESPGLVLYGKNIRYWCNTSIYKGINNTIYFMVPALSLMFIMIFVLLFPKMFVTADYNGLYSGFSSYLYNKRTILFINHLIENGFSLQGQGQINIKIMTSLVYGSFKLLLPAIGISIFIGLIKGAHDSYRPSDTKNFISLSMLSMPDVLVAFLGLQVIVMWSKNEMLVTWINIDQMRGIIMPVLALSIIPSVYISRLALIAVEEERHKGYVKGALAKGATKWQAFIHHLLPVMMLKIIDAMPSVMKLLIANLIIVEYFYGYPGIANYLITHMDSVTLVLLLSMGIGMMYLLLNFAFKLLAITINPMKRRGI